jgi:murein DD-endopeptidase MepM/ murein hydrolase activator NlpD
MLKKIAKIIGILMLIFLIAIFIFSKLESSVTINTDAYIYALPFKQGSKHKVVQGYGGYFSHYHKAALDFSMPIGTPILAAREGVVLGYKDNSNEGGIKQKYKNKANYIIIKHNDGSFGCYWHLQQNGVVIKNGKVQKGQLIGYSGATGLVIKPHLHFAVKNKLNYEMNSFVKTKFVTSNGVELLKLDISYGY